MGLIFNIDPQRYKLKAIGLRPIGCASFVTFSTSGLPRRPYPLDMLCYFYEFLNTITGEV